MAAGSTKLFVGNITAPTSDADLSAVFEEYGQVTECSIIKDFAFVHFATPEEARYAMQSLTGRMFKGKRLKVELSTTPVKRTSSNGGSNSCYICQATDHWAKNCPQRPEEDRQKRAQRQIKSQNHQTCKLFVGNIIRGTPDEELKAVFDQFGTVAECSVVSDYAFVHYTSFEEADAAVAGGNGLVFKGMRLKVEKSTSNVKRKPGEGNDKDACYVCRGRDHVAKECPQIPESEREIQRRRALKRKAEHEEDLYYDRQPGGYPPRRRPPIGGASGYYDDDPLYRGRRLSSSLLEDFEEFLYQRGRLSRRPAPPDPYDPLPPPPRRRFAPPPPPDTYYDAEGPPYAPLDAPTPLRRLSAGRHDEYSDLYGLPPRPRQQPRPGIPPAHSGYRDDYYDERPLPQPLSRPRMGPPGGDFAASVSRPRTGEYREPEYRGRPQLPPPHADPYSQGQLAIEGNTPQLRGVYTDFTQDDVPTNRGYPIQGQGLEPSTSSGPIITEIVDSPPRGREPGSQYGGGYNNENAPSYSGVY